MSNLSKVLLQSGLAFLVAGSIYTGEIAEFSDKIENLRNSSPVIGINTAVETSTRDFTNIFGRAGKETISELEVYYIPLKESEATLIKIDGRSVLVNTGTYEDAKILKEFVLNQAVEKIDHLILTLPTDENMGGAAFFIDTMPVDKIYMPLVSLDNAMVQNFFKVLQHKQQKLTKIEKGDVIDVGRAKINIINVLNRETQEKTDASIAFNLNLEDNNFLFTGDLSKEKQKEINWSDVDVLKLGYKGKDKYTSYELVKNSKPEYIIGTNTSERKVEQNVINLIKNVKAEENRDIEVFFSNEEDVVVMKSNGNGVNVLKVPYIKKKEE